MTSDWHLDATTAGVERFGELEQYVEVLEARLEKGDVDIVLFLGDTFDPGSHQEARWGSAMMEWAIALSARARHGGVFLAGNHDVLEMAPAGRPFTVLSPLAVLAEYALDKQIERAPRVAEVPACFKVGKLGEDCCAILALPYVARALAQTDSYVHALDTAFERAASWAKRGTPLVVVGHLSFEGMVPGSESEMMRGRDVMFPVQRVATLKPALVANGHYHKRQVIRRGDLDIQIVGAPLRMTFGERDDGERGFLMVDV